MLMVALQALLGMFFGFSGTAWASATIVVVFVVRVSAFSSEPAEYSGAPYIFLFVVVHTNDL